MAAPEPGAYTMLLGPGWDTDGLIVWDMGEWMALEEGDLVPLDAGPTNLGTGVWRVERVETTRTHWGALCLRAYVEPVAAPVWAAFCTAAAAAAEWCASR